MHLRSPFECLSNNSILLIDLTASYIVHDAGFLRAFKCCSIVRSCPIILNIFLIKLFVISFYFYCIVASREENTVKIPKAASILRNKREPWRFIAERHTLNASTR